MDKEKLIEMAKKRGLDVAEDAVQSMGELAMDIVGELIKESKNSYDDMIWAAMEGKARDGLKAMIDKIDGEKD